MSCTSISMSCTFNFIRASTQIVLPPAPKKMRSFEQASYNLKEQEYINKEVRSNTLVDAELALIQHKCNIEDKIEKKRSNVEDIKAEHEKRMAEILEQRAEDESNRLKQLHDIKLTTIKNLQGVYIFKKSFKHVLQFYV